MTAPQQTRQQRATQVELAAALYSAQTPDDASHVLALLLLDVPTARLLVTIIWPPTAGNPAPWRIAPGTDPAAWQAAYVAAAGDRIHAATAAGEDVTAALEREQTYAAQHQAAQQARAAAMVQVRRAKRQHGRLLGWYAHKDDRTTPACRIADRKTFIAATGPFPGTLHGGQCRCHAGPAIAGAEMVLAAWARAGLGPHAEGAFEDAA